MRYVPRIGRKAKARPKSEVRLRQSAPRPRLSPPAGPLRLCHILTLPRSKPKSEALRRSASMASTALVAVAVGGAISLGLVASSGVASCSLRAGGDSRRFGPRLVLLRRGGAEGEGTRTRNCPIFRCANKVDVVTEDDSVDGDVTDDGEDLEDAADDAIDADVGTEDELESSLPEDVEWIKQQPLPYPLDALEPYISKETVEQHWGVHQQIHVDRLNGMIGGSEWEGMSLGQMMLASFNEGREQPHPPFFHAAQVWNHDFYWRSMKPGGGGKPPERLLKFINRDFGSHEGMIRQFMDAALTQFGSGWVWLSYKGSGLPYVKSRSPIPSDNHGRLVISKTPNAINPLVWGHSPLLAIDVWEHAYYLDYEDRRADYVSAILEKLVSWETVESRLAKAVARAVERDEHLRRRILRKQRLAQANGQSRARSRARQGRQGDQEVARSRPVEA